MGHEKIDESYDGILEKADSRDKNSLETIIKNHESKKIVPGLA